VTHAETGVRPAAFLIRAAAAAGTLIVIRRLPMTIAYHATRALATRAPSTTA
jgi:hypothetical protein